MENHVTIWRIKMQFLTACGKSRYMQLTTDEVNNRHVYIYLQWNVEVNNINGQLI